MIENEINYDKLEQRMITELEKLQIPEFDHLIYQRDKQFKCLRAWPLFWQEDELTFINIFRIVNSKVIEGWGGVVQKMSVLKVTGELYEKLL